MIVSDDKRLMTIEDVTRIRHIQDPQLSPDGRWIAYVQTNANLMQRGYERNLWLVNTQGQATPTQLTYSGKDTTPRWSPDGTHLAFVSARSEKPQIYLLPVNRPGEARALTSAETGASNPVWSPDGAHIGYFVRMNAAERAAEDRGEKPEPPKDSLEGKHRKERKAEDEQNRFDPRLVERIPYRTGTAFLDDRYAQLYIVPTAEGLEGDEALPRRLTSLDANYSSLAWSPDGKTIYTTRPHLLDADETFFRYQNLYTLDVASGDETRWLADDEMTYYSADLSPDGQWLLTVRRENENVDYLARLCVIPLAGGDPIDLNLALDRTINAMAWTQENQLVVTVNTHGRQTIHRLDPATRTYTDILTDDQTVPEAVSVGRDGSLAYVSRTTTRLDELFYLPAGGEPRQMTQVNTAFTDEIRVLETHEVRFQNPHGDEIQGWYILPPDYEAGKQYPLALNIHGGPYVMWTPHARSIWHEWQTHAANGYVVFYCNPRGSNGYGSAHRRALHKAWGPVAMEDILAGVDHLIAQGFVDETRLAITGGSYGGYMTSWIISHTERFAAAVSQRGVYNLSSFYGTSDVPTLITSSFETHPFEDHATLWANSPVAHAHKITTPTLIIHAEQDYRVPIEQAEQFFATIRRGTDTPVKLLRYPREGHEMSRSGEPQHRISRLKEMLAWFDAYCKG